MCRRYGVIVMVTVLSIVVMVTTHPLSLSWRPYKLYSCPYHKHTVCTRITQKIKFVHYFYPSYKTCVFVRVASPFLTHVLESGCLVHGTAVDDFGLHTHGRTPLDRKSYMDLCLCTFSFSPDFNDRVPSQQGK
jgi:hypothetical protein